MQDNTTTSTATTNTTATTTTTNPLATMPLIMGIAYGGMAFFLIIYALLFFYFKKKEDRNPTELGKATGCYAKMYGLIIRIFPLIIKFLHYIVLVLIIVQIYTVLLGTTCKSPYSQDALGVKTDSPIVEFARWSLVIYGWFWVVYTN